MAKVGFAGIDTVADGVLPASGAASRRDAAVIAALTDAVARYPRWGFWKLHDRLRAEGRPWNHKRLHRVYCALRLNLPRRTTRRVPRRVRQPLTAPPVLNRTWALDFMTETLYDRRRIRLLTVIDEGNREGLEIAMGVSFPSRRVTRVLSELVALHGCPSALRTDNGPEFTAQPLVDWCAEHGVAMHYLQPGKPDQNAYQAAEKLDPYLNVEIEIAVSGLQVAPNRRRHQRNRDLGTSFWCENAFSAACYIERFNRSYRTEVLNAYLFESLTELRVLTDAWLRIYNASGPMTASADSQCFMVHVSVSLTVCSCQTARSEAVCRGAGCGRTRTSGSVGGQGQQRPWSTRPRIGVVQRELTALRQPKLNRLYPCRV